MRRGRVRSLAGVVAATIAISGVTGLAVLSSGVPVHSVEGQDSGVWVSNDGDNLFGRFNKTARTLDTAFYPPNTTATTGDLDVFQDGDSVVVHDRGNGRLWPVDTVLAAVQTDGRVDVPRRATVSMRGGTIAVLDQASGRIWGARYSAQDPIPELQDLDVAGEPLATLTKGQVDDTGLAVTEDGTIVAADRTGKRVRIVATDAAFDKPVVTSTARREQVRVTSVGEHTVLVDPVAGTVQVDDGLPLSLGAVTKDTKADGKPTLVAQQPGPDRPEVLLASHNALIAVPLAGGQAEVRYSGGTGSAAAPLVVGDCSYAAWAGSPGTVTEACGELAPQELAVDRTTPLEKPALRVNRHYVVLNDQASGQIFDPRTEATNADWANVRPKPKADEKAKDERPKADESEPPQAEDDEFFARPGRAALVYPLDNDQDRAGGVLSIVRLAKVTGGTALISPDGQSLAVRLGAKAKSMRLRYAITNGKKPTSKPVEASVTIRAPKGKNRAPEKLARQAGSHQASPQSAIIAGRKTTVPVTMYWRDRESDPVVLTTAEMKDPKQGAVSITPDGSSVELEAAPTASGTVSVRIEVSDGNESTADTIEVPVQPKESAAVNPATFPDVVRGVVGQNVVIDPTSNDIPGSDPADPDATWRLGTVDPGDSSDVTVTRDDATPADTTVTLRAKKAGTYLLTYSAAYGEGADNGTIRFDVTDAAKASADPMVMPDVAVVRGQTPTTIDLLQNDADPAGRLLTVQSVDLHDAPFEAAVVGGRWLRIVPTGRPALGSVEELTYAVTNGQREATGSVSVTSLAPVDYDAIATRPDEGVVRAGDTASFPVLENDTALSGSMLSLLPQLEQDEQKGLPAGQLPVTDLADPSLKVGSAFVSGSSVRVFAVGSVTSARTVRIPYVAQTAAGVRGGGQLTVTIQPKPTEDSPNNAPRPAPVESRVSQGDMVTIPIPTSGIDLDGDSVTVAGLRSAPRLGRVLGFGANTVTYQAFPRGTKPGTDTFSYAVADRFGATGTGTVQVAVGPPGQPQPAIPIEDAVTAAPGTPVTIYPTENDLVQRGDPVTVRTLDSMNSALPRGVSLDGKAGVVTAPAPAEPDQPLVLAYGLTSFAGQSISSTITLRSREGFQNPPRVYDVAAKLGPADGANAGAKPTATADVLARAYDPDGDSSKLKVTLDDPRATERDGKVTIDLSGDVPRSIPFTVTDESGAVAGGVISVPTSGEDGPYLVPEASIALDPAQQESFALRDFVRSTSGKPVRLASKNKSLTATPGAVLADAEPAKNLDGFTLKAGETEGPGALVATVVDSAGGKNARASVSSIPVTVGTPGPLLTCPQEPFPLSPNSPLRLDITRLCSVWAAENRAGLRYRAEWVAGQELAGVSIRDGAAVVELSAQGNATGTGGLRVYPDGFPQSARQLTITVTELPPPSLTAIVAQGRAGEPYAVDLRGYLSSPLQAPEVSVLGVRRTSGSEAAVRSDGSVVEITPSGDATGVLTFDVEASDSAQADPPDTRRARSTIRLTVINRPDPPTGVVAQGAIENGETRLDWRPGDDNGSPIQYYEVETVGGGRRQRCTVAPCLITGLDAGQTVRFVVYAVNDVGRSDASAPSPEVTVDEVPGAPVAPKVTAAGDGLIELAWGAAPTRGSPVTAYLISVNGGPAESYGIRTSATVSGLTNGENYTFDILAENTTGQGPPARASGSGIPFGHPATPADFDAVGDGAGGVTLSWSATAPNGPGPVTYSVTDNGAVVSTCQTAATSCSTSVTLDGSTHNYAITATNGAQLTSGQATDQYVAVGRPAGATINSIEASGVDQSATLTFTSGPTNGGTGTVTAYIGDSAAGVGEVGAAGGSGSFAIHTPGYGSYEVTVTVCNQQGECSDPSAPATVSTYGEIAPPVFESGPTVSGQTVYFTVTGSGKGRDGTLSVGAPDQTPLTESECATSCTVDKFFTFNVPAGEEVTYTITATITVGEETRSESKTALVSGPPLPPPSVQLGAVEELCSDGSAGCHAISMVLADFVVAPFCTISGDLSGGDYYENGRHELGHVLADSRVTVECGGATATWSG